MQASLTEEDAALMRQWMLRPAVLPWTEAGTAALDEFFSPIRQYRGNGLLQAAMYDAVVAAYDAQDAYGRPTPSEVDPGIVPLDGLDKPAGLSVRRGGCCRCRRRGPDGDADRRRPRPV